MGRGHGPSPILGDRDRRAVFPFPPQPIDFAAQWGTLFMDHLRAVTMSCARRLSHWQRDDSLRALCDAVLDALAHTFVIHNAQWRQRLRWTVRHWVATQFPFTNDEDPYPSPAVSTLPSPTTMTPRGGPHGPPRSPPTTCDSELPRGRPDTDTEDHQINHGGMPLSSLSHDVWRNRPPVTESMHAVFHRLLQLFPRVLPLPRRHTVRAGVGNVPIIYLPVNAPEWDNDLTSRCVAILWPDGP